jgi:hypothetical protein
LENHGYIRKYKPQPHYEKDQIDAETCQDCLVGESQEEAPLDIAIPPGDNSGSEDAGSDDADSEDNKETPEKTGE